MKKYKIKFLYLMMIFFIQIIFMTMNVGSLQAADKYSPNDVFSGVEYANRLVDKLLLKKGISKLDLPVSREKTAKPMHVYELHVAVLTELYTYALKSKYRPPLIATSTPTRYTPTDVYYLTVVVVSKLEEIYRDSIGAIDFQPEPITGKTPTAVYQEVLELYYRLNLLNGKIKVSPSEVYAHVIRAKEDLQYTLLILSKRLADSQESKKRLLVTAIFGASPDGSVMPAKQQKLKPADVLDKAVDVRKKLNIIREKNNLQVIEYPQRSDFDVVKPIDIFLQTQFIIAELNLLKLPMDIFSTTNSTKVTVGKTPSDVYYEMQHIEYMLDRLIKVQ